MGGLDDSVPNKPSFVNKVVSLTELPVNIYESVYSPTTLASMKTKRGCFSAIYSHGTQLVYVFGGLNYADKILKKCEVYNLQTNKWKAISSMKIPRKNATACALTTDSIYVFGGTTTHSTSDTIE